MTDEVMETLLEQLERKLGLDAPEDDEIALLEDELSDAEGELLLYLGIDELDSGMLHKAVELAALFYRRDVSEAEGRKSSAYSEGQVSQSDTYLGPEEYQEAVADILDSLARYRRVGC
ncbi:MAG: hypothetical protein LUD84_07460 [Clostridiales bacterium]|nr:hypothetical protein [Clostridiales bacterium]